MIQMNDKLVYTVHEVSSILHSSPNYIYELIIGSLKVLKSSLERFLIQNEGKDLSNLSDIKKIVIEVEVSE